MHNWMTDEPTEWLSDWPKQCFSQGTHWITVKMLKDSASEISCSLNSSKKMASKDGDWLSLSYSNTCLDTTARQIVAKVLGAFSGNRFLQMKISRIILGTFSWEACWMEIKEGGFRFCKYGVWEKFVAGEWPASRFSAWRSILEFRSLDLRFSMFLRFADYVRCCEFS